VVDEQLAFDAGALGLMPLDQQKKLTNIFLSHSHVDHIATLPLLIDNVYTPTPECITVYANSATVADLKRHVFNDHIWPDVFRLSEQVAPFVELRTIEHGQTIDVGNKRITAFNVQHTIPTLGYVVEDDRVAVALVADTACCDAIWSFLSPIDKLRAVFLEISFPNAQQWLADVSQHLTPRDFLAETRKLQREVDWFVTHMKPEFATKIVDEVAALQLARCSFAKSGQGYQF
jgi:cAMP phosphodiesterase